ncbi:MAG: hypothetical protein IKX47_03040, partial [Oscillospiraceae bacterium]|nr:hypothetical protein [Oscillospiraceae bacterium]
MRMRILKSFTAAALAAVFILSVCRMDGLAASGEKTVEIEPYIVVSLGDSYASGEGVEPFYDQKLPIEQRVDSEDWIAHRSENSWAGQLTVPYLNGTLADHKDKFWYFKA